MPQVAACTPATAQPPPPDWASYTDLDTLRADADVVVEGVAQRVAREDDGTERVRFSAARTLAGDPLDDDPALVTLGPDDPIDMVPGFRYVLFLTYDETDEALHPRPGRLGGAPGNRRFTRHPDAPRSLPATIGVDDLTDQVGAAAGSWL